MSRDESLYIADIKAAHQTHTFLPISIFNLHTNGISLSSHGTVHAVLPGTTRQGKCGQAGVVSIRPAAYSTTE